MERLVFDDVAAQATALAARLAADITHLLEQESEVVLAVSGGRSPLPLFAALAATPLPWSQVIVTLVDERVVPEEHPDSNARLVRSALLTGYAARARFVPLVRGLETAGEAVRRGLAGFRQPHLVVLGMGEDGHTASLFPDAPELAAGLLSDAPALLAITPGVAPHERISMTLSSLGQARKLYLSIQGAKKAAVLEAALARPDAALPVGLALTLPQPDVLVYQAP